MKTRNLTATAVLALLAGGSSALATPLVIQSNNSQQQIDFIVGPQTGRVEMYGLNGEAGPIVFQNVTSLTVRTGTSLDQVDIYFVTAETFPVTVNTRSGDSDVKVRYLIQPSNTVSEADVSITGGSGSDTVNIEAESFARGFLANWTVDLGSGSNFCSAKINLPQPSDVVSLNYAYSGTTGTDISNVDVISYSETTTVTALSNTGSNDDTLSVIADSFAGGTLTVTASGNMGSGDDNAELNYNNLDGVSTISGDLTGAGGNDSLKLTGEFSGSFTTILRGGAGDDLTDMFVKGDVTGVARQLTGAGDDYLKMFWDGSFASDPILNGGPDYDIGTGMGTFVNVEDID